MSLRFTVTVGLIAAMALSGAAAQTSAKKSARLVPVNDELTKRVEQLEYMVEKLWERVPGRYAQLDCDTHKYNELLPLSGSLPLFASCRSIEPYLEGHKVTISIGNPHSFSFYDIKGTIKYGMNLIDSIENSAEANFTQPLAAGSWTTVVVTVNPSKAEEMRYIALTMDIGGTHATR